MPKYYGIHLNLLENMAVALKDFAPAAAYIGMDGHGVMTLIHDYLVNNYDNDGFDMSQHLTRYSPMTTTGSGMGLFHTPLDKESLSKLKLEELPNGLDMTSQAVKRMLGDKELMQNEPMLRAYLSYAASQFRNAELERDDSTGYMSEVATGVCSMLAGQFTRLPTGAGLEQLRQNDPGAYEVAEAIMDYLNAHAEYCAPDEGNEADPAVQKAEMLRKTEKLQNAAQRFADLGKDRVLDFYRKTGNGDHLDYLRRAAFDNPEDNAFDAVHQLERERRLMEQGLSRDEALFGHKPDWNEIDRMGAENRDRKPNFDRYFKLHTGDAVAPLPEKRLAEYLAKSASCLYHMDRPDRKFSVSTPGNDAKNLMKKADFKAVVRAAGPEKIRQVLSKGDPAEIAKLVAGGPLRYAASAGTKESLRALGESMQTEGRSKEWKNLKSALTGKMMSTEQVFDAVENYLKGKKSVKNDPQREASVDLALNALAIAAKNVDSVAKARAQILADRFNKVRGAQPGHRDFVDLSKYDAPEQAQAEPRHDAQMYRGRSRASPKGRSAWRRRCGRNRSPS